MEVGAEGLENIRPEDMVAALRGFGNVAAQTWPGKLAISAYKGALAPGQAYQSTEPITTEQMIAPAQNMVDLLSMGAGGVPRGAAGMFGTKLTPGANKTLLGRASEMESRGYSPTGILRETGWFRGPINQEWSYEIPDIGSKINSQFLPSLKEGYLHEPERVPSFNKPVPLGQYFQHKELYQHVPDIEHNLEIFPLTTPGTTLGQYFSKGPGTVEQVALRQPTAGNWADQLHPTLVHELQHALQNRSGTLGKTAGVKAFDLPAQGALTQAVTEREPSVNTFLQRLGVEPEAGKAAVLSDSTAQMMPGHEREALARIQSVAPQMLPELEKFVRAKNLTEDLKQRSFTQYFNQPAELEARNVERRMHMGPQQRYAQPPWTTQPTPMKPYYNDEKLQNMIRSLLYQYQR